MRNNLKTLKQKIKRNQKELEEIYPYTNQIQETITMLIQQRASDTMINLWKEGVLELVSNIEAEIEYIEYERKVQLQEKLIDLKFKIDKHQKYLEEKFPLLKTVELLLNSKSHENIEHKHLEIISEMIKNIEKELKIIQYHQKLDLKTQLKNLQNKIDNNISKLATKYPISYTISEAIEILLYMEAPEDMIRPYLNGLEDYIREIDVELGIL